MMRVTQAVVCWWIIIGFLGAGAIAEDVPKRRWYRDLNARRIAELQQQLVPYRDVKFNSELYETRRQLERELFIRQNNTLWRVQSDFSRTTSTGKHTIPGWVKRFREFGDDIEFDPPINPDEASANRAAYQTRYEELYATQKNQVKINNAKWEADWTGWATSVQKRFNDWVASSEKEFKGYSEPLVAEAVLPRYEAFKKQLLQEIELRKTEIKAQKVERDAFMATQMDPYYRDLVGMGLDLATFESELKWVQQQEISYYTTKYSNSFFSWWGTEAKPGIEATWKSFEASRLLAEEAKIFAPYKTVRDQFLETYRSWEKETIVAYIPWWRTLPGEDMAWREYSVNKISGLPEHIRAGVVLEIDREVDARSKAVAALKEIETESLGIRQVLLDKITNLVRKAYVAKTDANGLRPEIARLWDESRDTFLPHFAKMRDFWEEPEGEQSRRKMFPGIDPLIVDEIKRYPLHLRAKDSAYVYHVELENAETTLRYEKGEAEKILLEFTGKRSFRAVGDDAILITQQIKLRDGKVSEALAEKVRAMETENPKGWAVRLHADKIVEVLELPDDRLSWAAVRRVPANDGKLVSKLVVLFFDAEQVLVKEFGLVFNFPGSAFISSIGNLETEPELWDRPRK